MIPQLEPKDYTEFPMLSEVWDGVIPPKDLNSSVDTTQFNSSSVGLSFLLFELVNF